MPPARPWERLMALPSIAAASPGASWAAAWVHSIKQLWNRAGSRRENTPPKSLPPRKRGCRGRGCRGATPELAPCHDRGKVLNHSSLLSPKSSICTQLPAPQIPAQIAIVTMSKRLRRLARSIPGSSKDSKQSIMDALSPFTITPSHLHRIDTQYRHPMTQV